METRQNEITVYPVVCKDKTYILNGETKLSGEDINRYGIEMPITGWKEMTQITLKEA